MGKKIVVAFIALVCLLTGLSVASRAEVYTGECGDNVIYTLDTEAGILTISGSGDMKNYHYDFPICSNYKSYVNKIVIKDGVTSVGDYSFKNFANLTDLEIGKSVKSIGSSAFFCCNNLINVFYEGDLKSWLEISFYSGANPIEYAEKFYVNGELLEGEIVIPENVEKINEYAFYKYDGITKVTIPDNVTSIGGRAFSWCSNLMEITMGDGIEYIGEDAFDYTGYYKNNENWENGVLYLGTAIIGANDWAGEYLNGEYQIKNGTTVIAGGALESCPYLTKVIIPNGVKIIGDYAFGYCTNLTEVVIPDSVKIIGDSAFSGTNLTEVVIPNSVTIIGNDAFYNCSSLTKINIPDGVKSIGSSAFYNCSGLTEITIPNSVESIGNYAFDGCSSLIAVNWNAKTVEGFSYSLFYNAGSRNKGIKVTFGSGVERIPAYCFNNSDVTEITISEGVTSIGKYAFNECDGITEITIPDSVVSIENQAFRDCEGLVNVVILNGEICIGNEAFFGCSNLTNVTIGNIADNSISGVEKAEIGYSAFGVCQNLKSVIIGNGITGIGNSAFSLCDALETVVLGNKLISIADEAFYKCSSLKEIVIPNSVTSIGSKAFYGCKSIKSLTIGEGLISIGDDAFYECRGLTEINWNAKCVDDFESYLNYRFYNAGFDGDGIKVTFSDTVEKIPAYCFYTYSQSNTPQITSVVIGNNVKSIGESAFYGCDYYNDGKNWEDGALYIGKYLIAANNISGVYEIKDGTRVIAGGAFASCRNLTDIVIPDGVLSIGNYAFTYCSSLTEITIPDSVKSIGMGAFTSCTNLKNVYCKSLEDWLMIEFEGIVANPMYYADNLYINGELLTGEVVVPDGIVTIQEGAFYNQGGITKITLPDSVTRIEAYAFYMCGGITEIEIPDNVTDIGAYAFYKCKRIAEITIPEGVTRIEMYTFSMCEGITEITILGDVTYIGERAFSMCKGITEITIPKGVTYVGKNAFYDCGLIDVYYKGEVIDWIGIEFANSNSNPMYSADNFYINGEILEGEVVIPDSAKIIRSYAFYGCSSLTGVTIPDSVTQIGEDAFWGCSGLKEFCVDENNDYYCSKDGVLFNKQATALIQYPARKSDETYIVPLGVTSIEDSAFYYCENIKSITIGADVDSIGDYAFEGNINLTEIIWNATSIDDYFGDYVFSGAGKNGDDVKVVFGEGVEKIPECCFEARYGEPLKITTIEISDSVTCIGRGAFEGCDYYNNEENWEDGVLYIDTCLIVADDISGVYEIKDGTTVIADQAFRSCRDLTEIVIPNSVTSIGYEAFSYCTDLTSVTIGEGVRYVGRDAFEDCAYYNNEENWEDGVLYIEKYLIAADDANDVYEIKDGTRVIADYAFEDLYNLTEITIPDSVTNIGEYAFGDCYDLEYASYDGLQENLTIGIGNEELTNVLEFIKRSVVCSLTENVLTVETLNIPQNSIIAVLSVEDMVATTQVCKYSGEGNVTFNVSETADSVKVIVWKSYESMKPVCAEVKVK